MSWTPPCANRALRLRRRAWTSTCIEPSAERNKQGHDSVTPTEPFGCHATLRLLGCFGGVSSRGTSALALARAGRAHRSCSSKEDESVGGRRARSRGRCWGWHDAGACWTRPQAAIKSMISKRPSPPLQALEPSTSPKPRPPGSRRLRIRHRLFRHTPLGSMRRAATRSPLCRRQTGRRQTYRLGVSSVPGAVDM